MHVRRVMLPLIVVAISIAAFLGLVLATDDQGHDPEVRIQARFLASGGVEVALQPRNDGGWGEQVLPNRRFLPADAGTGQWRSSSPVGIAGGDRRESAPGGVVALQDDPPLYCLITHERQGDEEFWGLVRFGALQWARQHPQVRVEVLAGPTPDIQSELIGQCVQQGALAIGATLPDPDGVRDAIASALEAGVYVASFNSGRESYSEVGSIRHVSVNEFLAGETAGRLLNDSGVEGPALCLIHESVNVALEERCDGFAASYAGEVRRVDVGATGVEDRAATGALIADALTDDVAAVLTLNSRISVIALEQIRASGAEVALATFDQNNAVLQALIDGEMLFALDTSPFAQAWYTLSTMLNNQPAFRVLVEEIGVEDPQQILESFEIQLTPRLIRSENAPAWQLVNRFTAHE